CILRVFPSGWPDSLAGVVVDPARQAGQRGFGGPGGGGLLGHRIRGGWVGALRPRRASFWELAHAGSQPCWVDRLWWHGRRVSSRGSPWRQERKGNPCCGLCSRRCVMFTLLGSAPTGILHPRRSAARRRSHPVHWRVFRVPPPVEKIVA